MQRMGKPIFFDSAATTCCCEPAAKKLLQFTCEDFGNPSSSHCLGQKAAQAVRQARNFFAELFRVKSQQIVFTGSGSEANNLAIYGVAMARLARAAQEGLKPGRILCSAVEHPAVRKTALSLKDLGFDVQLIPIRSDGQIDLDAYRDLLTSDTILVSVMRVNNIVGTVFPVEELARLAKERVPGVIFHSDCVQAFGKVDVPVGGSDVDLISVSAHKLEGPKGVGALFFLKPELVKSGSVRPLVWGGEQEGGFRSGTQNAGLIAAFEMAARFALEKRNQFMEHAATLRDLFIGELKKEKLIGTSLEWNSPDDAVPYIMNFSVTGYPSGPLARLLEERQCLVSTGSACSSMKAEPDAVLMAMGFDEDRAESAIRVSLCSQNTRDDVAHLAKSLSESIQRMKSLLGG